MIFKIYLIPLFVLLFTTEGFAQLTAGQISYERKTNLFKKYKDDNVKDWLKEENKDKLDRFELYFNDSLSLFKPQETDLRDNMSWATSKNTVYLDFSKNSRLTIKTIWNEDFYLQDSLTQRSWKITDSKRVICGYNCRKVIWQKDSTTRIYAWYAEDIPSPVGPENFNGLPGAILGLATEDGGIIYLAKQVNATKPDLALLQPKKIKHKLYTSAELRKKLEKDFGKNAWGKALIKDTFNW
jgi:GLPGLI family protein